MINPERLSKEKLRLYREGFCFDSERDCIAARGLLAHIAALEAVHAEAMRLLQLIGAEFESDPMATQCFDLIVPAAVAVLVEEWRATA